MNLDHLTISILFGTGVQRPEIRAVLDKFPQLKLLGQTTDPQSFVGQQKDGSPDVVLVEMNGESRVPEWLENLPREMPNTQVLLCSYSREPDFLIRAMQLGFREFLPLPLTQGDLEGALNRVRVARKQVMHADNRRGTDHRGYGPQRWGGEHDDRHKPGTGYGGIYHGATGPDRLGTAIPRCGNLSGSGIKLFRRGSGAEYCYLG